MPSQLRATAKLNAAIERSVANATGLHFVNSPAHASAVVRTLTGIITGLNNSTEDDPLLYAYQLKDELPKIASLVIALDKWAHAVVDATPDQIAEHGAQLCR